MLIAKTVITMDKVTNIIVKTKYSPMSGITLEDDGIISSITRRKTVKDTSTEVQSEIFHLHLKEDRRQGRLEMKAQYKE